MILHLTAKTETWSLINSSTISHSISENQPFLKEPVVAVTLPSQSSTMVSIGFCRSFMEIDGEDYLRTSITGSFLDLSIHGKAYRIPLDTRSPTPDSMFSYSACNKRHEVKNKDNFEEGSNSSRSSPEDPPLKRTYFRLSVQKVLPSSIPYWGSNAQSSSLMSTSKHFSPYLRITTSILFLLFRHYQSISTFIVLLSHFFVSLRIVSDVQVQM